MPTYNYVCESCGESLEEILKIADRFQPTNSPCKCGGKIQLTISSPMVCDAVSIGIKKPTQEFREVMNNMKKAHPLGNLKDY